MIFSFIFLHLFYRKKVDDVKVETNENVNVDEIIKSPKVQDIKKFDGKNNNNK